MADETVKAEDTPQEQESVTTVTDKQLSSAYDATQETEVKEEKQEATEQAADEQAEEQKDPTPEEPADNAERSRLGRRLKSLEEKLDDFFTKSQTAPKPVPEAKVPEPATFDDKYIQEQVNEAVKKGIIPETIITPMDQVKVNDFITGLHTDIGNKYETGYLNTLKSPSLKGDTPDDIHAEVISELQKYESQFNRNRFNNPALDAQMNYAEAKSYILQKRLSEGKPANVFKGKPKDAPPTGTSVTTRRESASEEMPELDEASRDFIKRTGMSIDSVKNALKGETPLYLKGRY